MHYSRSSRQSGFSETHLVASTLAYPGSFGAITALAEELDVTVCIAAPLGHGDDVVVLEPLLRTTLYASADVPLPDVHLDASRDRSPAWLVEPFLILVVQGFFVVLWG